MTRVDKANAKQSTRSHVAARRGRRANIAANPLRSQVIPAYRVVPVHSPEYASALPVMLVSGAALSQISKTMRVVIMAVVYLMAHVNVTMATVAMLVKFTISIVCRSIIGSGREAWRLVCFYLLYSSPAFGACYWHGTIAITNASLQTPGRHTNHEQKSILCLAL